MMNQQKWNRKQTHWSSVLALIGVIVGLAFISDDGLIPVANAQDDLVYVPLASPCRVVNTRNTASTHLIAAASRDFFSYGSAGTIGAQGGNLTGCDHPRSNAGIQPAAIAANVTAVGKQASGNGNITAYPAGAGAPGASTVNYTPAANIANSTIITLRTSDGSFTLLSNNSNVPAVVDVVGYFYPTQGGVLQVDCATQSLQAAIETAPPHGKTVINISGACSDDIFIRRNITIQGATGPGTDSITGDLSGFSSDPLDGYDLPALGGALVQKTLSAAIQIQRGRQLSLNNLTINAGANDSAVDAGRNSSVKLNNVTLVGGPNGSGLHLFNASARLAETTITGGGLGTPTGFGFEGSAVLAEMNSAINIKNNNSFTGGDGETSAFVAISNTSISLQGAGNIFNAGTPVGLEAETTSLFVAANSSLIQLPPGGTGNQVNGGIEIAVGSHLFFSKIALTLGFVGIFDSSSVLLQPGFPGDIVFNSEDIEVVSSSLLELGLDDGIPVTVNSGGVAGTMVLSDSATMVLEGGSVVNLDVLLNGGSSINSQQNSKIGGNLTIGGFGAYRASEQVGTSVSGTVTCFRGEAFDFTAAAPGTPIPLGSCF